MTTYLFNAFSVLLYAAVDYFVRVFHNSSRLGKRRTVSPGGASPFLFSALILQETLFLGLRDPGVGVDTERYVYVFQNCHIYDFDYEPGFLVFTYVLRSITENASAFLLLTAAISIIPIGVVVFRFSKMPYLSWYAYICLFYYTFTFSGIRQSIAMGLLMIAFCFLYKKKYFWCVFWIVLAASFHVSSIIFILAVFLRKHKWKNWEVPVLIIIYVIVFIFRSPLFNLIVRFMYEDYEQVQTNAYTWMAVNLGLFLLLLLISFFGKKSDILQLSLSLIGVGCIFMLLTSVGTNVLRVANYFCVFFILAIPEVLLVASKKYRFILVFAGIAILTGFYIYHLNANPYHIILYRML